MLCGMQNRYPQISSLKRQSSRIIIKAKASANLGLDSSTELGNKICSLLSIVLLPYLDVYYVFLNKLANY